MDLTTGPSFMQSMQGYAGARWGKESGPQFNAEISTNLRTTTGGGLNLIWNQPHAIFLAELEYRAATAIGDATRQEAVLSRYAAGVSSRPPHVELHGSRRILPILNFV